MSSFSVSAPVGHGDALAAGKRRGIAQRFKRAADVRGEAALVGADHTHGLVGLAGGHTAAAQDALVVVAHHMRRGIVDGVALAAADEAHAVDAVVAAELLQLQSVLRTQGQTVLVVSGKQQLQVRLAGRLHFSLFVTISMPSLTGYTHAVTRLRAPDLRSQRRYGTHRSR